MSQASDAPQREHTFRSLYEAVYPDLLRFVQRRAAPDHAEDVVAEAFLVVWRRLDDLPRAHPDARAWIFGIARNILLNEHRGEQRRRALGVRLADAMTSSDEIATEAVVHRVDLARAWRRLSERHQEALALAVLDGLNAPQAAGVLAISPVAFRLRLSRARRALRLHLDHLPRAVTPTRDAAERTTTR
ncbi:RNA polymerase sigma-70 factor (ECF subfamily) [Georgenia soli]|uniref:RNA polymerase sigma-70 factor (ECF subfamily) n=1 Tax=Georgenia soli TaxID=638953 RepID=A0A2A9EGT0_9MICO|nr:sigma-70 family RNA polymerase sigma factor [Georgenia soli]PFG38053.1 RNA polymerase sigma-70 factor (ECF subfamily) [Georgenia soli]